jgi:TolB-like protein/tetratricopeptide (TPR) repeat protein
VGETAAGGSSEAPAPRARSIAVLPLSNLSGDAGQEYFADGMTDELITRIARIGAFRVISRTSAMYYKGKGMPLPEIARELGVDNIVEGSVLWAENRVRISVQLADGLTGLSLWGESYEGDIRDILRLQSDTAMGIARELQRRLGGAPLPPARPGEDSLLLAGEGIARAGRVHPEANDLYMRGLADARETTAAGLERAIERFRKAIALDPRDARYHTALAEAHLLGAQLVGALPREDAIRELRASADEALSLDENSAGAHAMVGAVRLFGDWDWAGAERHLRRAIELDPSSVTARVTLCLFHTARGEFAEAEKEGRLALEVDPHSILVRWALAASLAMARNYQPSIDELESLLATAPRWSRGQIYLLVVHEMAGDLPGAIAVLERYPSEPIGGPALAARLRAALEREGPAGYWRERVRSEEASGLASRISLKFLAHVHARAGNHGAALDAIERGISARDAGMIFLRVEPVYDPLRGDPRFESLAARVGIPSV